MTAYEFFDGIYEDKLSVIEVYNYIEKTTENKFNKLYLFHLSFDRYFSEKREELACQINHNEIRQTLKDLREAGEHIPKPNYEQDLSNEMDRISEHYNADIESLFFSNELETLYSFQRLLLDLLEKYENDQNLTQDSKSINQLKPNNKGGESSKNYSNSIGFSVFEKIIHLTNYNEHSDETVIERLLSKETNYVSLSNAFKKELQKNIVIAQSQSSLKRLLKHYLFELNEVVRFQDLFSDRLIWSDVPNTHKDDFRQYQFKKEESESFKIADRSENYIIAKYDLLKLILNELELGVVRTEFSIDSLINEMKSSFPFVELDKYLEISRILNDLNHRKEAPINSNHINWLKNDDTLEQFIEALIDQNIIEEREPKNIINDHFKPARGKNREPKPIEWLNTQALLAYMINELNKNYIQTSNIWNDTASHFSVNGQTPKNLKQSARNYRENTTGRKGSLIGKPKNHKLIDNILQTLPE